MHRRSFPSTGQRGGGQSWNDWRGVVVADYQSVRPLCHDRRPQFSYIYWRDRPPGPPPSPPPNFIIQLRSHNRSFKRADVEAIIAKCKCKPQKSSVFDKGFVAGSLFFEQWADALEVMVHLWDIRLQGGSLFTPKLIQNVVVESDMDELTDRLKALFMEFVKGLIEGELVQKWQKKLRSVMVEINRVDGLLTRPHRLGFCEELLKKKEGLLSEKDLILRRIKEFKSAVRSILSHLERMPKELEGCADEGLEVFKFGEDFDWGRIYCLMMRECRRLDDGLPIYAYRQDILQQIHCQQIMVLIGETGSGKSTQLVQFLADSGVAANKSIICIQPRKLAAISLANRVEEESYGCYQDTSIICYSTYSSAQQFDSKVIYMTDHCLLQHYMNDKNLSGISCIIVDEAHERSLNTDLLLALVKKILCQRLDLRLIIMSATANANQLADYFFACKTFHVLGRNFPVEIKYVHSESDTLSGSGTVAPYVSDVVDMVTQIHRTESEGTILAFLTSQMEVEWACENFAALSAVALPLHGKLSYEDQCRVFLKFPGKRKVIFSTNVAETSLTIPGIKYVVDSGMAKESRFEPGTGMNVLRVCRISRSSADQRAGRAGRTEPGRCYRLYSEYDFELMSPHPEPEIRRVHLGVAVLRILALGIKNVQGFDFVDAPSAKAIEMAIRNLIQLGAVTYNNDVLELTKEGHALVRLGIEPRLGKIVLECFHHRVGKEGLVLAAVMANASIIFCRVGNEENKLKSDCLKVKFCHCNGDLFTLLSVYREWENLPPGKKSRWCWDNSINAKTMRRCQETVQELESCLKNELNVIIVSYWQWDPNVHSNYDEILKNVILSALSENVAMYSGYDRLGYEVASTGKHVQLHPSCSLLNFGHRPSWVVFSEILSISNQYLVCVTAVNHDSLFTLSPPPFFDIREMESQKLQVRVLSGLGCTLLKKFCGKSNNGLRNFVSRIRTACLDECIGIEVDVDRNEIRVFASTHDMEKVCAFLNNALEFERKWLRNECLEKYLYHGAPGRCSSVALFGAGAEIKHLELEKKCLTVDIFHSNASTVDDKELLMFLEQNTLGNICALHKFTGVGQDYEDKEKWGRVTFLTPDAAKNATQLNQVEFNGSLLRIVPSRNTCVGDNKFFTFPAVKAKLYWPRRYSRGFAVVKCELKDVGAMISEFSNLQIGGKYVRCEASKKSMDGIVINGIDRELSESEIFDALRTTTNRKILDFFLVRGDAAENLSCGACEEALLREITSLMPKRNLQGSCVRVHVFQPDSKDTYMRASIIFDGSQHLEAAKALEQIEGKVLPGCLSWQKIKCQQVFHSSVSCPAPAYYVIKEQLHSLLASLQHRKGAECYLQKNDNGSYQVKISANATKIVAELRAPLEKLMRGKTVEDNSLTPTILHHMFSRDGIVLKKSVEQETGTYILFDRQNLHFRIFGSSNQINVAQQRLSQSLLILHEKKQLEIHLRGGGLPIDLMKKVVQKFGPDLCGLKEMVPTADFTLDAKRHVISIHGEKELKQKVEEIISEIVQANGPPAQKMDNVAACPICLCEVEDGFRLEGCGHEFCRLCLVEQCESGIRSQDGFPIRCTFEGCGAFFLITDLRTLLSKEKLEELFRASLGAFVAVSRGTYRFCPSADCPLVYRVADPGSVPKPFLCGACYAETCTKCHLEYHPFLSCEKYQEFKEDPDSSLKEWCKGKEHVKNCPVCGFTIEKVDGCNHVECRCGRHVCWVCLEFYSNSDDCYGHLRSVHLAII